MANITTAPKPFERRYDGRPYYQRGAQGEHYVMYEGIRSRHETADIAWEVIETLRRSHALIK
jgi:hypothetical protein